MGITELSGAISGLKGALDLVKGVKAVSEGLAVQDVKMDLGQRILDAQMALNTALVAQTEASNKICELEREIARLKDWSSERKRYQLVSLYRGAFAYMPKVGMEDGEPAHWLCANCFDQGRKSFMQYKGAVGESLFTCAACKNEFRVSNRTHPDYAQRGGDPA